MEWDLMEPELRSVLKAEYGGEAPHRVAFTLSEAGFRDLGQPAFDNSAEAEAEAGAEASAYCTFNYHLLFD